MELEARAAQPGVLSLSGQALLKQAHDALAESDAFSATHALLQITRQDSTDLDLLEQASIASQFSFTVFCFSTLMKVAGWMSSRKDRKSG